MKLIPMRILGRFLLTFVLLQLGITLFFVLSFLFFQGYIKSIPAWRVPELLLYIVPFAQSLMGQFVILISCVSIYTSMTNSREIIGLRTSGISTFCVMRPTFIVAFFLSFFALWMTDVDMSWGKYGIANVVSSSIENILYDTLRAEHRIEYRDYTLTVANVQDKVLNDVFLTPNDSTKVATVSAESAQIEIGRRDSLEKSGEEVLDLQVFLSDSKGKDASKDDMERTDWENNPGETVIKITLSNVTARTNDVKFSSPGKKVLFFSPSQQQNGKLMVGMFEERPANMSFASLRKYMIAMNQNIQDAEKRLMELSAMNLLFLNWDNYYHGEWNDCRKQISQAENGIRRAKIEPTRRISNAANCFFLAWLIVPLAIRYGNASPINLFLVLFLLTAATYFLAQILILNCVKSQMLPVACMWLPNFCVFFIGWYWIRKVA